MKYIVCHIHNNSLGRVIEVSSESEGKDIIRGMAEEQFERPLTDEEIDGLENEMEIYNEEDSDNLFCFSLGIVE